MSALTRLAEKVEAGTDETDYWWLDDHLGNLQKPLFMMGQPAFYGSLDAAKALHEAVLPGWEWRLRENQAWVWRTATDMQYSGEVDDDLTGLPARAWLLAILRALAAGETP